MIINKNLSEDGNPVVSFTAEDNSSIETKIQSLLVVIAVGLINDTIDQDALAEAISVGSYTELYEAIDAAEAEQS